MLRPHAAQVDESSVALLRLKCVSDLGKGKEADQSHQEESVVYV